MPEGFNDDPNIVCKLNKSLYGLKQAAMLWHSAIDNHLTSSMGFSRLPDDRCIYVKGDSSDFVIVILYVDDIAIGSNKQSHIDSAFAALTDRFMIKRLGPLHNSQYLGMTVNISEDGSTIKMTQPHAIQKLLSKYKLESTTPTKSPFNPKVVLTKDNGDPINDITRYRSLIGGLFWIARTTRPDIMFTVSVLAQYQAAPTNVHMGAAIHILRYLAGTIDKGIEITRKTVNALFAWTDSSHNDIQRDMYGTTGFIITIGKSPITWTSRKQSVRVLSSSATEYIAADTALDDALWISSWIHSMNMKLGKEIIKGFPLLLTDSAPCIHMTTNRSIERNQPKFVDL